MPKARSPDVSRLQGVDTVRSAAASKPKTRLLAGRNASRQLMTRTSRRRRRNVKASSYIAADGSMGWRCLSYEMEEI